MLNKILLFLFISIGLNAQEEKRLALVIGNANYEKGELKNPVNDARLIASTLDSLGFDVILRENLSTKRDMTAAIREFGSKRSEYDVAFVYYAGHGIQVDDENFLLPTKEVFEEEFDVMDYGVSVQNIMRYLRAQTNEVNILILDACRDNPFESKWNTTRSLKGGGLAKIPAPTGSLIAFSTDSGQTAPDGDGENSVYTTSLSKNMLLEDTSIDQVFRNVRAEVLAETGGMQRPVEATQLTGDTFFLLPNKFEDEFKLIDNNLFKKNNLKKNIEICNIILSKNPDNYKALKKKAITLGVMQEVRKSNEIFRDLYKIKPDDYSNLFSWIYHENYSRTNLGFLNLNDPRYLDDNEFEKITKDIDIYKHPILAFVNIRNLYFKSQLNTNNTKKYSDEIEKYLEIINKSSIYDIQRDNSIYFLTNKDFKKHKEYPKEYFYNKVFYYVLAIKYNLDSIDLIESYEEYISNLENLDDPEIGFYNFFIGPAYRDNGNLDKSTKLYLNSLEKYPYSGQVVIDTYLELVNNYVILGKTKNLLKTALDAEKYFDENHTNLSVYVMRNYSNVMIQLLKISLMVENNYIDSMGITDRLVKIFEKNQTVYGYDYYQIFSNEDVLWLNYNRYLLNIILKRFGLASKLEDDFKKKLEDSTWEKQGESVKLAIKSGNIKIQGVLTFSKNENSTKFLNFYDASFFDEKIEKNNTSLEEEINKFKDQNKEWLLFKLYQNDEDIDYSILNLYMSKYILNEKTKKRFINWSDEKNIDIKDLRIFYIKTIREILSDIESTYFL